MRGDGEDSDEPDWVRPAQERRTPYTEDELDRFAADFIKGLDNLEWQAMKAECGGEERAIERIRAGFVKQDRNNLVNITPEGPLH